MTAYRAPRLRLGFHHRAGPLAGATL